MHKQFIHQCTGPEDPHAYDVIPEMIRTGNLDERCPTCHGHGQWNREIDLASQRSKREICGHCNGLGWIETGDDLVAVPDIIMSPQGYPMWITKYRPA
jgi:predicted SprT family Zn-dependent metalloprotease